MKKALKVHLLSLAVIGAAALAQAQPTAFTYLGQLNQNKQPVTGAYDMQFTVYDADTGNGLVAGPLTNAVGVTNGLFTARIDFGAGVFTGPPRWLQISVRPAGAGGFQTLSNRQELTSSPYSIRAQTAGDVANGAVVKSLNSLRDNVTLAAVAPLTLTPNGNTLMISSTGGTGGPWSLNGNDAYYNAGRVGIGTTTPFARLSVAGAGVYNNPTAAAITLDNTTPTTGHQWEWHALDDGRMQLADVTGAATRLVIDTAGNVGIGTITPATKLTVNYPGFGLEHRGGNVRLGTYVSEDGLSNDGGRLGTISNHKLHFFVNNGSPSVTINTFGDVGIGTTTPQQRLSILDFSGGNSSGLNITGVGVDGVGMAIQSVGPGGHKWSLVSGGTFNPSVPSIAGNFRIIDETANATRMVIDPSGNVGIGNLGNPQAKLDVQGTTRTRILTVTGGADIAEPFPFSSQNIAAGSVVVIDEDHPGKLKISTSAYDKRVAGIVSGANGVNPGISLHQDGVLEGAQNVALSGRVYVQADASPGAIRPGDLLTTSATPGHAMKVGDHAKAQGAILGKAMSALSEGKGTVLVLVTLQ